MRATMSAGIARGGNDFDFCRAALAWPRSTTSASRSTIPTVSAFPIMKVPSLNGSELWAAVPAWAYAPAGKAVTAAARSTRMRVIMSSVRGVCRPILITLRSRALSSGRSFVALVVFLRGLNVGGHRAFRPTWLAGQLQHLDVVNIGSTGTFVIRRPVTRARLRTEIARRLPFDAEIVICEGREIRRLLSHRVFA